MSNIVYWQEGDEPLDHFDSRIAVYENFQSDPFNSYGCFGTEISYETFKELLKGKSLGFMVNDEYCASFRINPDDLKKCQEFVK